jgi:hypothetical protein
MKRYVIGQTPLLGAADSYPYTHSTLSISSPQYNNKRRKTSVFKNTHINQIKFRIIRLQYGAAEFGKLSVHNMQSLNTSQKFIPYLKF